MKIMTILLMFLLSACAGSPVGQVQIETPHGNKLGCVQDLKACTEICEVQKNGYKVKNVTKLKPEMCEVDEKETDPN